MIFQDPMTSLNPVLTIGDQIAEALSTHNPGVSDDAAQRARVELLELVGVPNAERRVRAVSARVLGRHAPARDDRDGDRQRPERPRSPTSRRRRSTSRSRRRSSRCSRPRSAETHAAIVLITHDLGLIAELADRVVVMYAGRVVELGDVLHALQRAAASVHRRPHEQPGPLDADQEWLQPIPGQPPSMITPAAGLRVPSALHVSQGRAVCRTDIPELREFGTSDHLAALPLRRGARSARRRRRRAPREARIVSETQAQTAPERAHDAGSAGDEILRVEGLVKHFPIKAGVLQAHGRRRCAPSTAST